MIVGERSLLNQLPQRRSASEWQMKPQKIRYPQIGQITQISILVEYRCPAKKPRPQAERDSDQCNSQVCASVLVPALALKFSDSYFQKLAAFAPTLWFLSQPAISNPKPKSV